MYPLCLVEVRTELLTLNVEDDSWFTWLNCDLQSQEHFISLMTS